MLDSIRSLYPDPLVAAFFVDEAQKTIGLLLTDYSPDNIKKIRQSLVMPSKDGFAFPLLFTNPFIETSMDSFPLEFLELQAYSTIIIGDSPFKNRTPDIRFVRLQCEREIKGKSMHLKAAFVNQPDSKNLLDTLYLSLSDFRRIAIGLIVLKGELAPKANDILPRLSALYNIDSSPLNVLINQEVKRNEVEAVYLKYVETLDKLSDIIE